MKSPEYIWLLAGGAMQEGLARTIQDMGYRLILTDIDSSCSCSQYADVFIQRDTFDINGNLKEAEKLRKTHDIRACVTVAADCHPTVSHICRTLGLSGIAPEISNICRQKSVTRDVLTRGHIPQPCSYFVGTYEEAQQYLRSLGGVGVLKATDNSGSRGFVYLESMDMLTPQVFRESVDMGTTGYAIIEEALVPLKECIAEQSVETLWYNGTMYWLNWVDRLFRTDLDLFPNIEFTHDNDINWAVEIGHINPAIHPYEVKKVTQEMVERAGRCLGIHKQKGAHILKADIMLTLQGPIIIELTPRLSGGWDSSGTTPARGGNFQTGILRLALGEPLSHELWTRHFQFHDPNLFASILTDATPDAKNCIGRKLALGTGYERTASLLNALSNLREARYVI